MPAVCTQAQFVDAEIRLSTSDSVEQYALFNGIGTAKINNSGTIALSATLTELSAPFFSGTGMLVNTGPGLTDLVARENDGTRGLITLQNFGIDSTGRVVFEDRNTSGDNRIFRVGPVGAGSAIATVGDPGESAFDFAGPSVSGVSDVVYLKTAPGSGAGVQTLVRDSGAGLGAPIITNTGNNVEQILQYDVNRDNAVAYVVDLDGANPTSLFIDTPSGGSTLLADDTDFVNLGSAQTSIVMGADGEVYVRGQTTGGQTGIFRVNDSGITSVVNTTDDPFSSIGLFSVNADGTVVFLATSGGVSGLYTGTNPATDQLVGVGDTVDGVGVQLLTFGSDALNDNGQVVFQFIGSDGENHAAVGQIIPEPGTLAILALGGLTLVRRRRVA
ncbi:MAG: PEP-CTERM sorting domain-containing protein [Planctomycetota bacterium]